ncbi:MAG: phenylalanine--tRNA ligase subunit beta [Vicinamibacterales bacterium]
MKIVHPWLAELVSVPADVEEVAREISLRGFEVASVEHGRLPVIDFEITANRPDCLSHVGIAREAATIWGQPLRLPELLSTSEPSSEPPLIDVRLEDPVRCPRYCAQVFEVTVGPSPAWLAERLEAAGVRPINVVVDITNYVMLEIGQPMHAFDLARLEGRTLVIRRARQGERLVTLDGVERVLDDEMVVIADGSRATAVGGVMGGGDSEIGAATTRIALESAYFQAASIRRASKRLGLKTEASVRYERGADIEAPPAGIARAAALFKQTGTGRPIGSLIDRYPAVREPKVIALRAARIAHVLGMDVPQDDIARILPPLGFAIEWSDPDRAALRAVVPPFRVDVSREIDLIEEVGRHYGFDRLPTTFPALATPQPPPHERIARDRGVRRVLHAAGFSESMTFAFIERAAARPFGADGVEPAALANPLSEKFAVLRPSLLPGLLDSCVHNRRRERRDVKLFETGSRFTAEGEGRAAAFVWCGAAARPHWSAPDRHVDFFDAKGVIDALVAASDGHVAYRAVEPAFLVAGRAAEVHLTVNSATHRLGIVGQLAPSVAEARGFPANEPI